MAKEVRKSDRILKRLLALHPKRIDLSLGRIERLLAELGNPQSKLPPMIHVAGTNGKGSVVAGMRAVLEADGKRVHVYTSPHLVRFAERIRIAGKLVGEAELGALLEECEAANAGAPITFFEITTAAAFLAFSRHKADAALIEVGLGGRLDATNVLARPAACVITPVSRDHEEFLGSRLDGIAAEKAGILRAKVPAVVGRQSAGPRQAIERIANEVGAPLLLHGRDWRVRRRPKGGFIYMDGDGTLDLPVPGLAGDHQIDNLALAVASLRAQSAVSLSRAAFAAGVGWARWPGRLQAIPSGPLAARLPDGARLWLDGGHNPAAGRALARHFKTVLGDQDGSLHLVVGMAANKDPAGFLKPFAGLAADVTAVAIPGEAAAIPAATIATEAANLGIAGRMAADVGAALDRIAKAAPKKAPPNVLITGSLYLAGMVLEESGFNPD